MPEKTKLPPHVVVADDFEVDADGATYRPHAGERVTFRGRLTTNDLMLSMKLQQIDLSAPDAGDQFGAIREFVASRILSWEWTDEDGSPFPAKPTADDIGRLDMDELGWLLANIHRRKSEQDEGEASTPST